MKNSCTNLTEAAQSVQLLKINGSSTTTTMTNSDYIISSWNVDGYEWDMRFFPAFLNGCDWVALKFVSLGEVGNSGVRLKIRCWFVDPVGNLEPSEEKGASKVFLRSEGSIYIWLIKSRDVPASGHLINDSSTVECAITVFKELKNITIPSKKEVRLPMPPSDLHQHFGELLQSQTGADVTFTVSGESFAVHKLVLTARSPVFMAEFFGNMEQRSSKCVKIENMEAAVFKAMLHLLAAADRYGLDRLKLMCEAKLSGGIDVDTAATTLALAEQHSCALLKAKCVEFIAGSPEKVDAVLATEGYKHLVASCPLVLTELLKAARGRKN